ncbi:CMRF35-like molecule 2 isoform X3 [Ailuropoda melanoleuca]|uniref:CMRF35-like molecule 2 isoform X3 n=1 Tax=Ailuropoda melanoleuca TaxID=9646 RepID=UPI0014945F95|nr:CMRF35-like molecule 2 isoform X3 [Ailuropoda melanoleuca]
MSLNLMPAEAKDRAGQPAPSAPSPGSLSLMGPSSVTGTLGGSLRVRCQYEELYQRHKKYWCRGPYDATCEKIVETNGEEKEERSGRVSIRDHADKLTFIVTMENLTADDAGPYWCRIQTTWFLDVWSRDPSLPVNVSVSAAPSETAGRTTCGAAPAAFPGLQSKNLSSEEVLTYCSGNDLSRNVALHTGQERPSDSRHQGRADSSAWLLEGPRSSQGMCLRRHTGDAPRSW